MENTWPKRHASFSCRALVLLLAVACPSAQGNQPRAVVPPTAVLRDTNAELPLIGLGCSSLTKGKDVLTALKLGYRHLDTGRGTTWGYDEAEVGRAIAEGGVARNELFVQTKIHPEVLVVHLRRQPCCAWLLCSALSAAVMTVYPPCTS